MKHALILGGACLVVLVGAAHAQTYGGFGSAYGGYSGGSRGSTIDPAVQRKIQDLQQQLLRYRQELSSLKLKRDDLLGSFSEDSRQVREATEALHRRESEVDKVEAELQQVEGQVKAEQQARINAQRAALAPFTRTVDVDLKDASIRSAAEALSKVSGTQITVDPNVPAAQHITMQARGVSLGGILETVAQATTLKLAPSGNGVLVTTWPMLQVDLGNGFPQQSVFTGHAAPWADEWIERWGTKPSFGAGVTTVGPGSPPFPGAPGGVSIGAPPGIVAPAAGSAPQAGAMGAYPGLAPGMAVMGGGGIGFSGPLVIAGMSDHTIAVLEPQFGNEGMQRTMLVFYHLDNGQLKKMATIAHKLPEPKRAGMLGAGGAPAAAAAADFTGDPSVATWALAAAGPQTVIVGEGARDNSGMPGVYLTVYRFDGGQVKKLSGQFHRVQAPGTTPGYPGLGGVSFGPNANPYYWSQQPGLGGYGLGGAVGGGDLSIGLGGGGLGGRIPGGGGPGGGGLGRAPSTPGTVGAPGSGGYSGPAPKAKKPVKK